MVSGVEDLPWLRSGERIETCRAPRMVSGVEISPGSGQGSGLKLTGQLDDRMHLVYLPWLRSGERIETERGREDSRRGSDLPWLRSGERIET